MKIAAIGLLLLATPAFGQTMPPLETNGHPFAALPVPGGLVVSVSANDRPGSATGLRVFAGTAATGLTFRCFQPVPAAQAFGLAVTPDGRTLLLAAGNDGLMLLNRDAVMDGCRARAVTVPMGAPGSRQGTFDIAVAPDGAFAFVSNEYGVAASDAAGRPVRGNVGVVALDRDAAGSTAGGRLVGRITTGGSAVTGVTLSPDGRRLYVTSEIALPGARAANGQLPALAHGGCR